jgi:hypothetical protein
MRPFIWILLFSILWVESYSSPLSKRDMGSIDVSGDSMSQAYNAKSCNLDDQPGYSWATNNQEPGLCPVPGDIVVSLAERIECNKNAAIAINNHAVSGHRMRDFPFQANTIMGWIVEQDRPRFIPVLLGHNDICGAEKSKYNTSCSSMDQDVNNYCRTTNFAFERDFRRGLDVLVRIRNAKIGVAAPVMVSQLCNHKGKEVQNFPPSPATTSGRRPTNSTKYLTMAFAGRLPRTARTPV